MSMPKSILKKTAPRSTPDNHVRSGQAAGPSARSQSSIGSKSKSRAKSATGSKMRQSIGMSKRKAKSPSFSDEADEDQHDEDEEDEDESDGFQKNEDEDAGGDGEQEEMDTDEEISRAKGAGASEKSKKATKRKRPTTAETFGSTLTSLLADPSTQPTDPKKSKSITPTASKPTKPTTSILSLSHAKLPPSKSATSLEHKAARQIRAAKEEKQDKARVKDVVEGWGPPEGVESVMGGVSTGGMEFEKGLRKVAQRGVIKLFNAILVASRTAESTSTSLSAQAGLKDDFTNKNKKKDKDNILGRGGKEGVLTQEGFLDMVRRG